MNYIKQILDEIKGYYTGIINEGTEGLEFLDEDKYTLVGELTDINGNVCYYIGAISRPYYPHGYTTEYFLDKDCTKEAYDLYGYKLKSYRKTIYPNFKGTIIWDMFMPNEEEYQERHSEFVNQLNIEDGYVILSHSSSYDIEGPLDSTKGTKQSYSLNSDIEGTYYWASSNMGIDPSNAGRHTYYVKVPLDWVYDMENNIKNYPSINFALNFEKVIAKYWDAGKSSIVAVTKLPLEYYNKV